MTLFILTLRHINANQLSPRGGQRVKTKRNNKARRFLSKLTFKMLSGAAKRKKKKNEEEQNKKQRGALQKFLSGSRPTAVNLLVSAEPEAEPGLQPEAEPGPQPEAEPGPEPGPKTRRKTLWRRQHQRRHRMTK